MVVDQTFQVDIQCREEQWTRVTDPTSEVLRRFLWLTWKQLIWMQGVRIAHDTGPVQYCTQHLQESSDFWIKGFPLQQLGRYNS